MANLKLDLINKIKNDKYYDELELVRLAEDPNMIYIEKINKMQLLLKNILIHNSSLELIEFYFNAPQAQQQSNITHQPNNGQSHAE